MNTWQSTVVLAVVCLCGVLAFSLWQETRGAPYSSPCVISWDENDGTSTLCVLTPAAAELEHTQGRIETRTSS